MGNILRKTVKKKRATSHKWGEYKMSLVLNELIHEL
jgi:hypothetical protein